MDEDTFSRMISVGPLSPPMAAGHAVIGGTHEAYVVVPAGIGPFARFNGPKHLAPCQEWGEPSDRVRPVGGVMIRPF